MAYFAPYIDGSGIHMPTYEDRLENLITAYREIFGVDSILDPSVPDYQLLSTFARALDDTSALVLDAYDSRNPQYASGNSLDILAPQYGLERTASESDANLRNRMINSMAGKAVATGDVIEAAIKALRYVRDARVYINETGSTDANGIPAHSIAAVVYSGLPAEIREVIYKKKAPGIGTYGTTSGTYTDPEGNAHTINFSSPTTIQITLVIKLRSLRSDFVCADQWPAIQAAIISFVQAWGIGKPFPVSSLYGVIYDAVPSELRSAFSVNDIMSSSSGGAFSELYPVAWNQRVTTTAAICSYQEVT